MGWSETKMQLLTWQEESNEEKREHFRYLLGEGGHYTAQQKEYVSDHIQEFGVRATALRHTFASHLVMKGVDLATVKKLMGHSDIDTTMIYSHLTEKHVDKAVDKLNF